MNAVLLITRYNLEEMRALVSSLVEKQTAANSGKCLIMGGYYFENQVLQELGAKLRPVFEVVELTKVQVSEKATPASQCATMIATWLMQRMTTVPGPWAVFDGGAEIIADNPLSILQKIHNANGAENTGRATSQGGGRVPVGPLVIGAMAKRLRTLRSVSGMDWRQRGRWVFNVCSWYQVPAEEYPFRLVAPLDEPAHSSDGAEAEARRPQTQVEAGGAQPVSSSGPAVSLPVVDSGAHHRAKKPVAMDEMYREGSSSELVEAVASSQDKTPAQIYEERLKAEESGQPKPGDLNYQPPREMADRDAPEVDPHPGAAMEKNFDESVPAPKSDDETSPQAAELPPKPFVRIDPSAYEKVSREVLLDQVAHRTGKKPHPRTGAPKLIAALKELDDAARAVGKQ